MITYFLKNLSKTLAAAMVVVLGSFISAGNASVQLYYSVTDLGPVPGSGYGLPDYKYVLGINDVGQVVLLNETNDPSKKGHVFLWDKGKTTDLGILYGDGSAGNPSYLSVIGCQVINNAGQVVGFSQINGSRHAIVWQNGTIKDLGTFGGTQSFAFAINNRGQIVGYLTQSNGQNHAFIWNNGKMTDLDPTNPSSAYGINDFGKVVGTSVNTSGGHMVLWQSGKVINTDLGLGGIPEGINDLGMVLGSTSHTPAHAAVWQNGNLTDLGILSTKPNYSVGSKAYCVNNRGSVVGQAPTEPEPIVQTIHAFIWNKRKMMVDLNNFLPPNSGWLLIRATGINNRGQIVGEGYVNGSRVYHGFLLTPTLVTQ